MNIKAKRIFKKVGMAAVSLTLVAGMVTGIYYGVNSSKSRLDDGTTGGLVVQSTESSGIKLTSAVLTAEEYESYGLLTASVDSAYTINAKVNPSTATISGYTWSLSWDTTHDGYSNDEWYSDGDTDYSAKYLDVEDFVTLSSTSGSSVVVSCSQAFGCTINIKCVVTSYDGSNVSATTTADYCSRVTGAFVCLYERETDTDSYSVAMSCSASGGTATLTLPAYSDERYDENSYSLVAKSDSITVYSGVGSLSAEYTVKKILIELNGVSGLHQEAAIEFSPDGTIGWSDFCFDLLGTRPNSDSNIKSLYDSLAAAYSAGTNVATMTVTLTDDFLGETLTYTSYVKINPANLATSATSAYISGGSLVF